MTLMPCRTLAAVCEQHGALPLFRELDLEAPRADEVIVRIVATGVCHTDVAMLAAERVSKPAVLGHEGAGIVEAVGVGVRSVEPGDHVVMSFASCGTCSSCLQGRPAYCRSSQRLNFGARRPDGSTGLADQGRPVGSHFFGQSSFATRALCYERSLVKVPRDVPLRMLGPLGCGLQTGAGAVLNSLAVRPGQNLAVLGVGAVGLSAVMAARIAGAERIVAVDVHEDRLSLARDLGATHTVDARPGKVLDALLAIASDGIDALIDTSGHIATITDAMEALAPLGKLGIISSAKGGSIPVRALHMLSGGRSAIGIHEGDSVPQVFIPQLIHYYRQGLFPFDRLLKFYRFADIGQALDDLEHGKALKPVLVMESEGEE